ncbi:MAG: hypothetical protein RLZZ04_1608 [Cyanobacteriota bacterium]|jgi:NAD(P)-dependent dehydrogenase (short-subunit alcohol dehydrogenase family)
MDLAADKIRVNAVCSGSISTEATKEQIESLGLEEEQAYRTHLRSLEFWNKLVEEGADKATIK